MDAFNLLKADHRKVEELFKQLESESGKRKLAVFDRIRTELELHTHIEEKIFYPALEKPEQTHDLTLEAYEEHDVVKKLLKSLSRARTANDEWEAQAKVLQENVEHHVEEEEGELFKKARSVLNADEIESLGEKMEAERERRQNRSASKGSAKSVAAKRASSGSKSAKTSGRKSGSKKSGSKKSSKKSRK